MADKNVSAVGHGDGGEKNGGPLIIKSGPP